MSKRQKRLDQLLQGGEMTNEKAEDLLAIIANLNNPWRMGTKEEWDAFVEKARNVTEAYWPDLWRTIEYTGTETPDRAMWVLSKIQKYLRAFWETSDPYKRDW